MKMPRVPRPFARRGFPFTAPTWPGTVERPLPQPTLGVAYDTEWARSYPARLGRAALVETVTRPLVRVIADPAVRGVDRLEQVDGPAVFAANHASHVDTPLLLSALPPRFRHRTVVAAGADYFFDKRWKAAMWSFAINAIPIERTRISTRSLRLCADALADGWSLVIFPEGGRSPDGWGAEHRPGAAFLAARAGVPIVPVHLEGTRRILRKGRSALRPSSTTVTFGPPIRPADGEDARALAARVERAVAVLAEEHASDWWVARRRAASGDAPSLRGPAAGSWRRAWALGDEPGKGFPAGRREGWPRRTFSP